MIVAIFQQARSAALAGGDPPAELIDFAKVIVTMADNAEEALGQVEALAAVVHGGASWSKDLRKPMQKIERALRQYVDGRAVFRQWKAEAQQFLDSSSSPTTYAA